MDVHVVVLDLLKIPYEKVTSPIPTPVFNPSRVVRSQVEDTRMNHIMKLAHNLLQYFSYENPVNQSKLYELYFQDYQQISEVRRRQSQETIDAIVFFLGTRGRDMLLYFSQQYSSM